MRQAVKRLDWLTVVREKRTEGIVCFLPHQRSISRYLVNITYCTLLLGMGKYVIMITLIDADAFF